MSTNEYVPSEEEVREEYVYGVQEVDMDGCVVVSFDEARARWDRFLARVRREAKAEAWQEGVNFALPGKETYWISKHNPHRATEYETGDSDEHR